MNEKFLEGAPGQPKADEKGEQAEIVRITREINVEMEKVIRKYPEQYLWMHNRRKQSDKKAIFENLE